jgi:hypothetical protein
VAISWRTVNVRNGIASPALANDNRQCYREKHRDEAMSGIPPKCFAALTML